MKRSYLFFLAAILTLTIGCGKKARSKAATAYVDASGNVIHCAATEEALRAAIETSRTSGKKEIVIADGVLTLSAPILLDERDCNLTVRGSGNTILSGGVDVTFHAVENENYWAAQLPDGLPEPYLFYVPGSGRRERAVFPRSDWLKNLDNSDLVWLGKLDGGWDRPPTRYELTRMSVTPDELPDFEPADADVEVAQNREVSVVRIASYDPNLWEMTFAEPLTHPVGASARHEYRIHNIEPGMEPGRWRFHRATREIYYFPQANEQLSDFHAVVAVVEPLLTIRHGENITLADLTFFAANADLRRRGAQTGETSGRALPAVEIANSCKITLSRVALRDVAGTAVEVIKSRDVALKSCTIADVGDYGVYGADVQNLTVCDSKLYEIDHTAIRASGQGNQFFNNEISQINYSGISASGDAEIRGNLLSGTMRLRNDGGAIALTGGKHAKVYGNKVVDLPALGLRHAIHIGETTEFAVIEKNEFTSFFPVMANCARDVVLRGNTFTYPKEMIFDLVNSDRFTLEKNVIKAPKIIFSAPENAWKKSDNLIEGAVEERVKPRGFFFFYDEENTLCCKPELKGKHIDPLKWQRIVCMGDSITAAGPMIYELQLYLACKFPQRHIEVFNAGVAGETAACGWERLEKVLALKPDAVILSYGMNDVGRSDYRDLWPESVEQAKRRERGIESCETYLKKIVDKLQADGVDVVVLPPFPYDEYGTRPEPDDNFVFCNSVALEKIALFCHASFGGKIPLPLTRTALCRLYAHYPELRIAPDRVHPDERGYWLIVDEIVHELYDRIPAEEPLPYPLTEKMVEFSRLPPVPGVGKNAQLHPLRYLGKNGAVDAPTQILREKMKKLADAEGIINTMAWFDLQATSRGIDPADFVRTDARLQTLAPRWGLVKTYEKYRIWRTRRAELAAEAAEARADFFRTVDELHKKEK